MRRPRQPSTGTMTIWLRLRAPKRRCGPRAKKPNPICREPSNSTRPFFAVYEASHSPVLVEIIRALWLKAGPVINLDLRANPERLAKGDAIRFHADVRRAIAAKEQAAARTGVAADISGAAKVILSRGGLAN
jgi:hypothetical protein